jgi:hypothetical protein
MTFEPIQRFKALKGDPYHSTWVHREYVSAIRQEIVMRKYIIASVAVVAVLVASVTTKTVYFAATPAQAKATSPVTIEPLGMHYGALPLEQLTDRTFVFSD